MKGWLTARRTSLDATLRSVLPTRPDPARRVARLAEEALAEHRLRTDELAALTEARLELERRLGDATSELTKVDGHARQAAEQAAEAAQSGDQLREAEQTAAASSFAARVPALQREVDDLTSELERATDAVGAATEDAQRHADAAAQRLTEALDLVAPADRVAVRARVDAALRVLRISSDRDRDTTHP